MHIIGYGRRAREGYPGTAGGAAAGALRNRNVAGLTELSPFTPVGTSTIAALVFTPRVSGVVQVAASIALTNGATTDTYSLGLLVFTGTGFTASGGEATSDGWVMGSDPSPTVGGVTGAPVLAIASILPVAGNASSSFAMFGITTPAQHLGIPLLVVVELIETGGGHPLAAIGIENLSAMELP